jgi:Trk K+ transport system NAD-binding subunit
LIPVSSYAGHGSDRPGAQRAWCRGHLRKVLGTNHGRIQERTRTYHVVYPEAAIAGRAADLITARTINFIEVEGGFAIVKTCVPHEGAGRMLAQSALRSKYGLTVVGVKRPKADFTYAPPEIVAGTGDLLIVSGRRNRRRNSPPSPDWTLSVLPNRMCR